MRLRRTDTLVFAMQIHPGLAIPYYSDQEANQIIAHFSFENKAQSVKPVQPGHKMSPVYLRWNPACSFGRLAPSYISRGIV